MLPFERPVLSANEARSRHHWSVQRTAKRTVETAVWALAKQHRIPRVERCVVMLTWHPPDRSRRDANSLWPTMKACCDGLVAAGVLEDDDSQHVEGELCRIGPVTKPGRIELAIADGGELHLPEGRVSTGMPAGIWLIKFGVIVRNYFGHVPYQVGSSLTSKTWRDVDVRLILPDEEFVARFGSLRVSEVDPRFAAITLAFCALGAQMTGLPIDFQIQPQSHANSRYGGQMRSALVEVPMVRT